MKYRRLKYIQLIVIYWNTSRLLISNWINYIHVYQYPLDGWRLNSFTVWSVHAPFSEYWLLDWINFVFPVYVPKAKEKMNLSVYHYIRGTFPECELDLPSLSVRDLEHNMLLNPISNNLWNYRKRPIIQRESMKCEQIAFATRWTIHGASNRSTMELTTYREVPLVKQ